MNIELKNITVRELVKDYVDNEEDGVRGFGGALDIRPAFQREYVYEKKQRDAVIDTVQKGYPLNVMYWAVREDGTYEVIDGQQRTISVCRYVVGDFQFNKLNFHNLQDDQQNKILDYPLTVYLCTGTPSEKLEWFKTINIAGLVLTDQERRNAVYAGPWTADAKRWFSKTGGPAYAIGSDYVSGSPIRQDYLETAIEWINNGDVEGYMADHMHDPNAGELWRYFQAVITWVETTFIKKRVKMMKGRPWGTLYNEFKDKVFDTDHIEAETARLVADDEVEKKNGIYEYILTGDEKHLGLRTFSDSMKQKVYEKQKGLCLICKKSFDIAAMEGDHIVSWKDRGKTIEENLQMLCKPCNRTKSGK